EGPGAEGAREEARGAETQGRAQARRAVLARPRDAVDAVDLGGDDAPVERAQEHGALGQERGLVVEDEDRALPGRARDRRDLGEELRGRGLPPPLVEDEERPEAASALVLRVGVVDRPVEAPGDRRRREVVVADDDGVLSLELARDEARRLAARR